MVDIALLEHCVREDLNATAPRVMAVLKPLKVIIDNYPEGESEQIEAINNPEDPAAGSRQLPFSRELYIEQDDFREEPPAKFFRLAPGREVRLRYAYFIRCIGVEKNEAGEVTVLHCIYDPSTLGGSAPDGRKVKATIHWVSAAHACEAEVRLYDRLFAKEDPSLVEEGQDFTSNLNPNSVTLLTGVKAEPGLAEVEPGYVCQFERLGYFCLDPDSKVAGKPVFNRTVQLRDEWARLEARRVKG